MQKNRNHPVVLEDPKMKKTKFLFLLGALTAVITVAAPSRAALVYSNSEVVDTSTNLVWLNTNLSEGMEFQNSYTASGWRPATLNEIQNFFVVSPGVGAQSSLEATNNAINLMTFMGATQTLTNCISYVCYQLNAWFRDPASDIPGYTPAYNLVTVVLPPPYPAGFLETIGSYTSPSQLTNANGYTYGQFLVQAVPIPAAIWLFGPGLLGLISIAKRRK